MDKITKQLWITDIEGVSEEDTSRFDAVVSVCQDKRDANVGCEYHHFKLADDEQSEERWGGSCDYNVFLKAARRVEMLMRNGKTVLIHCHKGRNRSVAVAAAVLAVGQPGLNSVNDALDLIMYKRPIANPNETMRSHAKRYVEYRKKVQAYD